MSGKISPSELSPVNFTVSVRPEAERSARLMQVDGLFEMQKCAVKTIVSEKIV